MNVERINDLIAKLEDFDIGCDITLHGKSWNYHDREACALALMPQQYGSRRNWASDAAGYLGIDESQADRIFLRLWRFYGEGNVTPYHVALALRHLLTTGEAPELKPGEYTV